jgi:endonuclease YncB( thermonuclease family)
MQPKRYRRRGNRSAASWARIVGAIIVAVLAALFGRDQVGTRTNPQDTGPLPETVRGAARPIDGDSMKVGNAEVRLKGIDAPEGPQMCTRNNKPWACGEDSRKELVGLIGKDVVVCTVLERDRFSRYLSRCTAGGRDLNAGMVASGLAVAYGGYLREEGEAKARKRGLWGSEFTRPREWRDDHQRR